MQDRVEPGAQFGWALRFTFAHEQMQPAIEVVRVVKRRNAVLFRPIGLEIGEWPIVEAADQRAARKGDPSAADRRITAPAKKRGG